MNAREQFVVITRAVEAGAFEHLGLEDDFANWPREFEGEEQLDNQVPTPTDFAVAVEAVRVAGELLGEPVKPRARFEVFEIVTFGLISPGGWTPLFRLRLEEALWSMS